MSSDPEGIIYYGIKLSAEDGEGDPELKKWNHWDDCNEAWQKLYAPKQPKDRSNCRSPEWEQWREDMKQWKCSLQCIEIEWSGCEQCETFYIHFPALERSVEWSGQMRLVMVNDIPDRDEAIKWLKLFCEFAGVEYVEPAYYLAVRYF